MKKEVTLSQTGLTSARLTSEAASQIRLPNSQSQGPQRSQIRPESLQFRLTRKRAHKWKRPQQLCKTNAQPIPRNMNKAHFILTQLSKRLDIARSKKVGNPDRATPTKGIWPPQTEKRQKAKARGIGYTQIKFLTRQHDRVGEYRGPTTPISWGIMMAAG